MKESFLERFNSARRLGVTGKIVGSQWGGFFLLLALIIAAAAKHWLGLDGWFALGISVVAAFLLLLVVTLPRK
jgi:hypothetical protein